MHLMPCQNNGIGKPDASSSTGATVIFRTQEILDSFSPKSAQTSILPFISMTGNSLLGMAQPQELVAIR